MKAWDRQPGESAAAYEAFKRYIDTSERRLQKVATELQKSPAVVRRWAYKFDWKERAGAWDSSLLEVERQERAKKRREKIKRQEEVGELLLSKAEEILKQANVAKGSFYAATQMADLGCRLIMEADELEVAATQESQLTINITRAGHQLPTT